MQRLLPPTLLIITWMAMVLVHLMLPISRIIPSPLNFVGVLLLAIGLAMAVVGSRLFKAVDTNIKTFDKPDKLVTTGLFAHSRNPMYLGFALAASGLALCLGTMSPIIIAVIFFLTLDRWYVQFEEAKMQSVFGEDYTAYKRRVRRWL